MMSINTFDDKQTKNEQKHQQSERQVSQANNQQKNQLKAQQAESTQVGLGDGATQPASESSQEEFILPPPPYTLLEHNLDYQNCQLDIFTANGQEITGNIEILDSNDEHICIKEHNSDEYKLIGIEDINYFRLVSPYQISKIDKSKHGPHQYLDPNDNLRPYQINFNNGSKISGNTLGSRIEKNAIHLYDVNIDDLEEQDADKSIKQCFHIYILKKSIKKQKIGQKIGQILLSEDKISEQQLSDSLADQKAKKPNKIGKYLVSNKIVNSEALSAALDKQKHMPHLKLGELLVNEDIITQSQLEYALKVQQKHKKIPLGELLIDKGVIEKEQLQKTLAKKLGIPFVNLKEFIIEPEILKLLSDSSAFKYRAIPLYFHDQRLVIATEDPLDWQLLESLRFHVNFSVDAVMASPDDITWALQFFYSTDNLDNIYDELDDEADDDSYESGLLSPVERSEITENVVVKVVNKMIHDAHRHGVSDIHIEPGEGNRKVVVRFRKDGTLMTYYKFPSKYKSVFISRLKVMAHLDISLRFKPQDGKIKFKDYSNLDIELRISTIPTSGGIEDVVIRLLGGGKVLPISAIGLNTEYLDSLLNIISEPHGLILVCGPTGSGKTTTLHSVLGSLNTPDKKIWTAEDPVEITQPGLRQVQINEKQGLSFALAMRSFLRADPDIIMIGEMRDEETASTAIEASLTGHLVLSTLHTNSAAETIIRLLDMDIDPYNFADALLGVISQRLVKTLCVSCKEPYEPDDAELEKLAIEYARESTHSIDHTDAEIEEIISKWREKYFQGKDIELFKSEGCQDCMDNGYRGRIGVYEMLIKTHEIEELILKKSSAALIEAKALSSGMYTIKQDGIQKVLQGFTDYSQVRML